MKHFTVYNAEIFFVASSNPIAWLVKRYKLKLKKGVLWDTLMNSPLPVDDDDDDDANGKDLPVDEEESRGSSSDDNKEVLDQDPAGERVDRVVNLAELKLKSSDYF